VKTISRRQLIQYGALGAGALVVSNPLSELLRGPDQALAATTATLNFTMTDAVKQMATHVQKNVATCYFWCFKEATMPAEVPGPQIYATEGDSIPIVVTNALPHPHAFAIPGIGFDTGSIAPGATYASNGTTKPHINVPLGKAGTYLYYDDLNEPVNRVMGLHGAFIVMPHGNVGPFSWSKYPYNLAVGHPVRQLYDDFGSAAWWPGLPWHVGSSLGKNPAPPFRQYVWLTHQASPVLFAEVGNYKPTASAPVYPAGRFVEAFLNDPFIATSNDGRANTPKLDQFNRKPHFFTINGQSGHFCHNHPAITPMNRVGEPCLVRVINAGLYTHSMHIHANHVYVTSVDNVVSDNPPWVDVFFLHPMGHMDYTVPYMRPPDVPNARGIGRGGSGDAALSTRANPPFPGFPGAASHPAWPPTEEFTMHHPQVGTIKKGFLSGNVDIAQPQSPLCYPMHDHSEPSQSTQGGNYNTALISGIYFIGDDSDPVHRSDFPIDAEFQMMLDLGGSTSATGPAAGKAP
jgi:FtsP/CotA-like multicopper oxidase with cupredoxin domain